MTEESDHIWTEKDSKSANKITGLMFIFVAGWITFLIVTLAPSCPTKPKTPEEYFKFGNHYAAEGDFIQAQKYFTKAIKDKPDYTEAYYARINAWEQTDSLQNVINDYTTLLSFPQLTVDKKGELLYLRGSAYYLSLKDTLACNDWKLSRDLGYNKAYDRVRFKCK